MLTANVRPLTRYHRDLVKNPAKHMIDLRRAMRVRLAERLRSLRAYPPYRAFRPEVRRRFRKEEFRYEHDNLPMTAEQHRKEALALLREAGRQPKKYQPYVLEEAHIHATAAKLLDGGY